MNARLLLLSACIILMLRYENATCQTIVTVGPGQQHPSITAAYAAIPNNFSGKYVIELQSGYSQLNETFPIRFFFKAGSNNANNTITVRPAVSGLIIASATNETLLIDSTSNIIIDGRVGGQGSTADLSIINTSNGTPIVIKKNAKNNIIRYLKVQYDVTGLHMISSGQNQLIGNIVEYCIFDGIGNSYCEAGISISHNIPTNADANIIRNNEISNFRQKGIFVGNANHTIVKGNSLYRDINVPNYAPYFIEVNGPNSYGHVIKGNYIGGTQPNCGGGKLNISNVGFRGIYAIAVDSMPSYIDSNIITNIKLIDTLTAGSSSSYTAFIAIGGDGLWKVGSLNANIIGDTSSHSAIEIDVSGGGNSSNVSVEVFNFSEDAQIMNNIVGGIDYTMRGGGISHFSFSTSPSPWTYSKLLFANNKIGSFSMPDNIRLVSGSGRDMYFYFANNIDTVRGNIFSGVDISGFDVSVGGISDVNFANGNLINQVRIINTNSPPSGDVAHFIKADYINDNTIQNIYLRNHQWLDIIKDGFETRGNTIKNITSFNSRVNTVHEINGFYNCRNIFYNVIDGLTLMDSLSNTAGSILTGIKEGNTTGNVIQNLTASADLIGIEGNSSYNVVSYLTGKNVTGVMGEAYCNHTEISNLVCENCIGIDIDGNEARGNEVKNLNGSRRVYGISVYNRDLSIKDNVVHDLVLNDTLTSALPSGYNGLIGIYGSRSYSAQSLYSGTCYRNEVYNLYYSGGRVQPSAARVVYGIYYYSRSNGVADSITYNKIHNIQASPNASYKADVVGIWFDNEEDSFHLNNNIITHISADSGATSSKVTGIFSKTKTVSLYNNIVHVGFNEDGTTSKGSYERNGIYLYGLNTLATSIYFNTVYLAGDAQGGSNNSYALRTRWKDYRIYNNLLFNAVTTIGGTGKNYATTLNGFLNQQVDHNIYRLTGANSHVASIDTGITPLTALTDFKNAIIGQNLNSLDVDPVFINSQDEFESLNLGVQTGSPAVGAGVIYLVPTNSDLFDNIRNNPPTIGAVEYPDYQVPLLDSVASASCSTSPDGSITFHIPNGVSWSSCQVLNSIGTAVQTISPASGTKTINTLYPDSYTLRFTGSSGNNYDIDVTVDYAILSPTPPVAAPETICTGSFTTVNASGANNYQWFDAASGGNLLATGSSFTTPVLNAPATFYIQTMEGSCVSTRSSVTINAVSLAAPVITLSNGPICIGQSATLGVSASGTVQWFDTQAGGSPIGTGNTFSSPVLNSATTYYSEYTVGSCTSPRSSYTVNLNPLPPAPIPVDDEVSVCAGQPVTVSVQNGPYTYYWYSTPTGGTAFATSTSYTVSQINLSSTFYVSAKSGNCFSPRTEIRIIVTSVNAPAISPSSPHICPGENVTITATAGLSGVIRWFDYQNSNTPIATGASFTTPTISSSKPYYADVLDTSGCNSTKTVVTVTVDPRPNASIITNGNLLISSISNASAFQWLLNGNPISGSIGSSHTALQGGNYSLIVTNFFGCTDTSASVFVVVDGITIPFQDTTIFAYPNPNDGNFFIYSKNPIPQDALISVFDVCGRNVNETTVVLNDENRISISMPGTAEGVYWIRIGSAQAAYFQKIVISR